MIDLIVTRILAFYPEVRREDLVIEQDEEDEQFYGINEKGHPFLWVTLGETGSLASFSVEEEERRIGDILSKELVLQKVMDLVDAMVTVDRASFHLSIMLDLDEYWRIEFVRKDPYMGLELPNSGIGISMNKDGLITSAYFEAEQIAIEKPNMEISAAEAKAIYLEHMMFTPAIMKFDEDYVGGDDAYHFVYYKTDYIMAIEGDGTLQTIEAYGGTIPKYADLSSAENASGNLYELIGRPVNFVKIRVGQTEEGRTEIWGEGPVLDTDEEETAQYEITFDAEERICSIYYEVDEEEMASAEPVSESKVLERAVAFLQSQYENAGERFRLVEEERALLLYDDEGENEQVYAYEFNFHQFERGVIVEHPALTIEIDARCLAITRYHADPAHHIDLSEIAIDCVFPKETAKELYASGLAMETSWSKEVDEDPVCYRLIYLSAFPETVGHMRAIDAKTGKRWFIDTSWMEEFET